MQFCHFHNKGTTDKLWFMSHKIDHFGHVLPTQSWLSAEQSKPSTTKANSTGTKWQNKISPVWDCRSTPLEWRSSIRDLDLDLRSGHMAYHHASVYVQYIPNVIETGNTFLWTDYLQGPLQVQSHMTQKLGQTAKIWPDKN